MALKQSQADHFLDTHSRIQKGAENITESEYKEAVVAGYLMLKQAEERIAELSKRPEFDLTTVQGREQAVIAGLRAQGL